MDAKTQKNVELLMEISEDAEELGAYKTHYQNVSKMAKRYVMKDILLKICTVKLWPLPQKRLNEAVYVLGPTISLWLVRIKNANQYTLEDMSMFLVQSFSALHFLKYNI